LASQPTHDIAIIIVLLLFFYLNTAINTVKHIYCINTQQWFHTTLSGLLLVYNCFALDCQSVRFPAVADD